MSKSKKTSLLSQEPDYYAVETPCECPFMSHELSLWQDKDPESLSDFDGAPFRLYWVYGGESCDNVCPQEDMTFFEEAVDWVEHTVDGFVTGCDMHCEPGQHLVRDHWCEYDNKCGAQGYAWEGWQPYECYQNCWCQDKTFPHCEPTQMYCDVIDEAGNWTHTECVDIAQNFMFEGSDCVDWEKHGHVIWQQTCGIETHYDEHYDHYDDHYDEHYDEHHGEHHVCDDPNLMLCDNPNHAWYGQCVGPSTHSHHVLEVCPDCEAGKMVCQFGPHDYDCMDDDGDWEQKCWEKADEFHRTHVDFLECPVGEKQCSMPAGGLECFPEYEKCPDDMEFSHDLQVYVSWFDLDHDGEADPCHGGEIVYNPK